MTILLTKRVFLIMDRDTVIGVVAKDITKESEPWVPFSLGTERTFTQLAEAKSRHAAEKAVRASWGVDK